MYRLRAITGRGGASWWKIAGGNDRLPRAFADRLAPRIRYGAAVERVRHDASGVVVSFRQAGELRELHGDHAVCTIPFPVVRTIDVAPLSPAKRQAIAELPYANATKAFLQTRTRFWRAAGLSGFADTDLPVPSVWDLSEGQPGQRGLLRRTSPSPMPTSSPDRRPTHGSRGRCLTWSGSSRDCERSTRAVRQSEGRLHFAGDHASAGPGWMQGALESGNRAARAIDAAPE